MSNAELHSATLDSWGVIGGPSPGAVAALTIAPGQESTFFAGTRAGLYRSRWSPGAKRGDINSGRQAHWQRLPSAPLEILSLGLSPQFEKDSTLLAGTAQGLLISRDGGECWQALNTPMPDPVILCLCYSPNYRADGIILAGTLEDGIYYSDSRGERWMFRGIGLLDATVYSLAISPHFARDEMVFAGTESALYYSYNGARAWKQLDFPQSAAPILSLALSPHFSHDQTLYAGTEHQGLYRSPDLGKTWQKVDLPATTINSLAISPEQYTLFAATNSGVYSSGDGGRRWTCLFNRPDAFSIATSNGLIVTSLPYQGIWLTSDMATWYPLPTTPARLMTGMLLSPYFDTDAMAILYGPQEGIWRTRDGGQSWTSLDARLSSLDIRAMALSATPQNRLLVAASADGVLMSKDAGENWSCLAETPASLVALSPNSELIAVASSAGEILLANTLKSPWQSVPIPGGKTSQLLALAIDDDFRLAVALLDVVEGSLSIWEGKPGHFERILTRLRPKDAYLPPLVRFWVPAQGGSDKSWYASLDHQVWELRSPPDAGGFRANLLFEAGDGGSILTLTASQTRKGIHLFACTGRYIYRSIGTSSWTAVHDFGDERAVALALSPSYPDDPTAYALLLGGSFCSGILK